MYLFRRWFAQHLLVWKIASNVKLALEVTETMAESMKHSQICPINVSAHSLKRNCAFQDD